MTTTITVPRNTPPPSIGLVNAPPVVGDTLSGRVVRSWRTESPAALSRGSYVPIVVTFMDGSRARAEVRPCAS